VEGVDVEVGRGPTGGHQASRSLGVDEGG
jgi:hypothetical protein